MLAHVIFAMMMEAYMQKNKIYISQRGFTLIELMIAMAIGLLIVIAATTIYLSTVRNQRALERKSGSLESGAFVLQMLGREIMNAGFYPANFPPATSDITQQGMFDTYPPLQSIPRKETDWQNTAAGWPPSAYMTGIYGCEGGEFDISTATCPSTDSSKSDSIVINYFTNDVMSDGGMRKDCTGSSVDNDPSNAKRTNASKNTNKPPVLPLFVSNKYTVRDLKNFVDQGDVSTKSFVCSGNGANEFGAASLYQPILSGIKEIHFKYGVYSGDSSLTPDKFYSASEVNALPSVSILGQSYNGWQRITSVRVCVLSQSQGGGVRLEDKSGDEATYLDCEDKAVAHPTGQWVTRFVKNFGVRNGLKQSY